MEVARGVVWGRSRKPGWWQAADDGLRPACHCVNWPRHIHKNWKVSSTSATGWRDRSRVRGRMVVLVGGLVLEGEKWAFEECNANGGLWWGANCVQLSGWLALTECGHWHVRHRWGRLAGTGTSCHSSQHVSHSAPVRLPSALHEAVHTYQRKLKWAEVE